MVSACAAYFAVGVMLAVAMGASGDHSLFPVYAHIKSVRAMRYDHFARRHESLPLQSQFATQKQLPERTNFPCDGKRRLRLIRRA